MGSKELGVATLVANETAYTVKFSINVLADAEEADGSENSILAAFKRMELGTPRMSDLRWLLWSGLRTEHPQITKHEVGHLIEEAGMEAILKALMEAFNGMASRLQQRPQKPTPRRARG